jgi:phage gpG-like protein
MIDASLDLREMEAALRQLEQRTKNLRAPVEKIGELARREADKTFSAQGPNWPKSTYRGKPKGTPTGVKSGRLKADFTREGAPGNISKVTAQGGEFGARTPYADKFQRGGNTRFPKGRQVPGKRRRWRTVYMPPRPVVTDPVGAYLAQINQILADHFEVKN